MEDGEERSEAQESHSEFRNASKLEESFRLSHELYLKSGCPVGKQQVYFLYGNIATCNMQCYHATCNKLCTVWLVLQEYMNIHWNVSFLDLFVMQN